MGVTCFTFSGGTENSCYVVCTSNVSHVCEIQITAVGFGFASECGLQGLFSLCAFYGFAHLRAPCFQLNQNGGDAIQSTIEGITRDKLCGSLGSK
jgi:hypothetical protein